MSAQKNWIKKGLTAGAWTDLVTDAGAVVTAISVAQTDNLDTGISVRLATSAGVAISTLLPMHTLGAMGADVLHFKALTVESGQKLQIWSDYAGVDVVATGTL